jgi:hypothetical protein
MAQPHSEILDGKVQAWYGTATERTLELGPLYVPVLSEE